MIRNLKKSEFYIVMGSISVAAALFFTTLTKPEIVIDDSVEDEHQDDKKEIINQEVAKVQPIGE